MGLLDTLGWMAAASTTTPKSADNLELRVDFDVFDLVGGVAAAALKESADYPWHADVRNGYRAYLKRFVTRLQDAGDGQELDTILAGLEEEFGIGDDTLARPNGGKNLGALLAERLVIGATHGSLAGVDAFASTLAKAGIQIDKP